MIRPGLLHIVRGWILVLTFEDLTDRIERAAEWAKANGPLTPAEKSEVTSMVTCQVACAIRRGDFEPFISADTDPFDVLNFDLEVKP